VCRRGEVVPEVMQRLEGRMGVLGRTVVVLVCERVSVRVRVVVVVVVLPA
jgi:hypothetical protein